MTPAQPPLLLAILLLVVSAAGGSMLSLAAFAGHPALRLLLWAESLSIAAPALMLAGLSRAGALWVAGLSAFGFWAGWKLHRRFSSLPRKRR